MAKGARASVIKANRAKLRATVFGPVSDERTKRLSAKLQELASKPLAKDIQMADVVNVIDNTQNEPNTASRDMEIDGQPNASKPTTADDTSTRVQKRGRNKSRSKMTFKPHPGKLKRMAAKKK